MFRRIHVEFLSVAVLPLGLGLAFGDAPDAQGSVGSLPVVHVIAGPVSYAQQVAPIFASKCSDCHAGSSAEVELDLSSYAGVMKGSEYGTVVEAGDPDASILIDMISAGEMPQDAPPLPPEEIELIRSWIAAGAQDN